VGIYVLNMESARESLWVPIVRAWSDRGGRMMIGVAAIFAFTANVFAVGVDSSSGPAFALTAHVGVLACVTVIISRWRQKGLRLSIWAHRRDVLKAVVCMAGSDIVFPIAYTLMPVMALVIIGKRTGQTLWVPCAQCRRPRKSATPMRAKLTPRGIA
jgi:hypothetical protein